MGAPIARYVHSSASPSMPVDARSAHTNTQVMAKLAPQLAALTSSSRRKNGGLTKPTMVTMAANARPMALATTGRVVCSTTDATTPPLSSVAARWCHTLSPLKESGWRRAGRLTLSADQSNTFHVASMFSTRECARTNRTVIGTHATSATMASTPSAVWSPSQHRTLGSMSSVQPPPSASGTALQSSTVTSDSSIMAENGRATRRQKTESATQRPT
mmetsp:Transcript_13563/g.47264  ORF Transcript_13563/g.47264 Transcript_13563/m.47264 type:complete len:216 (-) Transcript_13563:1952-2599(-)